MDTKTALSELANQVLAQTDITQVIGERIKLIHRGKGHIACCPFHDEKTPSFHVISKDQYYYCFGCKASGNAIHFLREYDRMSFFDALKYLARQAGITLPALEDTSPKTSQAEIDCLQAVSEWYENNLKTANQAIEYLKNRKITGQTAKTFGLGFAKDLWDDVLNKFNTSSEALNHLHTHGLLVTNDNGRRYDRFRNRLMFPIRDARGQCIAFGARTLGDDTPKYLNSPQTPLFHKSEALYGIFEMLNHCRHPKYVLVVEGYMDVIALHQAGIPNAVATLGTASNQGQLRLLQRHADRIIVCFDGDEAGQKAAWHALTEALPIANERLDMRFLFLPDKHDPDSYVMTYGKAAMETLIEQATPLSEAFFNYLDKTQDHDSLDGKARYAQAALTAIQKMPIGLLQDLLKHELAKRLELDDSKIDEHLHREQPAQTIPDRPVYKSPPNTQNHKPVAPINYALSLLLKQTELAQKTPALDELCALARTLPHPPSELKLLVSVYEQLTENPSYTTGQLINKYRNEALQQHLLALSAQSTLIDKTLEGVELNDALNLSIKWCKNNQIESLMNLGRERNLTLDEKKKLQELLISNSGSGI